MCCPPPPKPCCCPPPPCCEPPKCCCMDQPKPQCCQRKCDIESQTLFSRIFDHSISHSLVMLIPTGQEVMMPCPKPCCCCPSMSGGMGMGMGMGMSGGCGMGRKRRSISLYRRAGLYERLAAAQQAQASAANAYGSAMRAKFAAAAQASSARAYGCVPCACQPEGVSPLSHILNPKFVVARAK